MIHDKLNYIKETNKKVFFFLHSGSWRKGVIDSLNKDLFALELIDGKLGRIPISYREIKLDSIVFAKELESFS